MSCQDYEELILDYALGDLDADAARRCAAHIAACPACREVYESYRILAGAIADEPDILPTRAESEAMARALANACPAKARQPIPQGLPAMIWASILTFVLIVSTLALQVFGCVSLAGIARSIGPAPIAAAIVAIIFITSFVPIAAMAKRKPLNGMTFRR